MAVDVNQAVTPIIMGAMSRDSLGPKESRNLRISSKAQIAIMKARNKLTEATTQKSMQQLDMALKSKYGANAPSIAGKLATLERNSLSPSFPNAKNEFEQLISQGNNRELYDEYKKLNKIRLRNTEDRILSYASTYARLGNEEWSDYVDSLNFGENPDYLRDGEFDNILSMNLGDVYRNAAVEITGKRSADKAGSKAYKYNLNSDVFGFDKKIKDSGVLKDLKNDLTGGLK